MLVMVQPRVWCSSADGRCGDLEGVPADLIRHRRGINMLVMLVVLLLVRGCSHWALQLLRRFAQICPMLIFDDVCCLAVQHERRTIVRCEPAVRGTECCFICTVIAARSGCGALLSINRQRWWSYWVEHPLQGCET